MPAIDLSTFKPRDANELFDAIWGQVVGVVVDDLQDFRKDVEPILRAIATKTLLTARLLAEGSITREDADLAIQTHELALNNVMRFSAFVAYDIAEKVRKAVFSVVVAAIKNLTGVGLAF